MDTQTFEDCDQRPWDIPRETNGIFAPLLCIFLGVLSDMQNVLVLQQTRRILLALQHTCVHDAHYSSVL